jgi:poly(A) polymerase
MTLPSLVDAPWLNTEDARAVFGALAAAGFEARAVGGAVRNSLLGLPVKDVDVATTARPLEVMSAANMAGLRTVETGLQHGTITVISGHTPFEVTTLRRDVETDGRHASVAFTSDWADDARRRDFTINALYCDRDGRVHDPLAGYPDIVARRVRFIGSPHDRIREDYLRILRFFRFTSEYASNAPDPAGLAACAELKDGIKRLSGERLRAELLRILTTPRAIEIVQAMDDSRILSLVLGVDGNVQRFGNLVQWQMAARAAPDAILCLGALALNMTGNASILQRHLRLSNNEYERLSRMAMPDAAFDPSSKLIDAKEFVYRHGTRALRDGVMLAWASAPSKAQPDVWLDRLNLAQRWRAPLMPVNGADVLALGIESGPNVGRVLSAFEDWWIAADFPDDATQLAAKLGEIVKVTKA